MSIVSIPRYVESYVIRGCRCGTMAQKHCALLLKKNQILAIGTNFITDQSTSQHAEIDCLMNFICKRRTGCADNLTLVVCRYVGDKIKNSKPCTDCLETIKSCKFIRRVIYSTENGTFLKEKVSSITNTITTSGRRQK